MFGISSTKLFLCKPLGNCDLPLLGATSQFLVIIFGKTPFYIEKSICELVKSKPKNFSLFGSFKHEVKVVL